MHFTLGGKNGEGTARKQYVQVKPLNVATKCVI